MKPFRTKAVVHTLNDFDEVTIISHKDNKNVVAEYEGQLYTAIFNVFNGLYYVDDLYGKIENQ